MMIASADHIEPFPVFLDRLRKSISSAFQQQHNNEMMFQNRGFPPGLLHEIMASNPFSTAIPQKYGGRGGLVKETLAVLSIASYESLALSLTFGINMGLFLQPVAKYAQEDVKAPLFKRFLKERQMGGLMITEPDFGSDALHMKTFYTEKDDFYHIQGKKHWAGLTGMADYWLLTARRKGSGAQLQRDIDFFICDNTMDDQRIMVEEFFDNLGLYFIPYGRNHLDVMIPRSYRLEPESSGIKMMLDLLHRSRLQFPGMAMGFLERIMDEAMEHCQQRQIGGKRLLDYDQVQERVSRLQGSFAVCSAMCVSSSQTAGLERDLSDQSLAANAIKSVITDIMQNAAQSLLQLVGAKAYKLSHIAGRGIIDSRPFQIFEGSNDILYNQVSEHILKQMKRLKVSNLYEYLCKHPLTEKSSESMRKLLDFDIKDQMPQRKMVELGRILSRIISMDMLHELGQKGFNTAYIQSGLHLLQKEIHQAFGGFFFSEKTPVIQGREDDHWLSLA